MTGSALREASAASQLPLSPSGVRRPPLLLAFGRPTLYLLLSVAASAVLVAPVLPFRAPPWAVILSTLFTLSRLVDFKHAVTAYNLGCLPPPSYPHRDPVLGTDWVIAAVKALKSNSLLEYFQSAHDKFGSTFSHNVLGSTAIMTSEPANLKAVLQGSFEDWPIAGPRLAALANVLGSDSIFQSNGQHWHRARSMMRPAFVRDEIADLEAFEKHVGNLVERAKKEMRGEGEGALGDGNVDLQKLFYMMTMDSATDFLFGHCTDTLSKSTPDALAFNKAFEYALQVGANRGRLGPLAGIVPDKAFDDSLKTMHAFLDKYVREAMNDEKNKLSELRKRGYVFLPELLKAGAPIEYVRDQVLSLMLAGRDTTASALSALFWNLSRRPDVVAKLRDEIAGLRLDEQGGRMPTWQELKGMRYMQYCIKEVLRLYPPVPSNSRGANKDTILPVGGGPDGTYPIYVRKGTTCRWVPNSLHRRKDIWGEDADEFRPERWETLRPTWEYLPFSGGPRICIGQQFALTQISYATLRLLREFKSIEARDEKPMLQTISTTASLVNGVVVTMELA